MSTTEKENKTDNNKAVSKDDEIQKYNSFNYWKNDNYDQHDLPDLSSAEPIVDEDDLNGDERSQSICSQTAYINTLTNTLKQYDKDNDGYINWDEFCAMARDKQYTNYERDQLWIQLGPIKIPTKNSFARKISIQTIMQSSSAKQKGKRKFIGGKYVHVNTYIGGKYDSSCEFIARSAASKDNQSHNTIPDYNINNISNINYQNAYKSMNMSNTYKYNNNINNNINIAVGKGGYGSYDTTSDRNNVCWEFNTFAGCRKGSQCKWEHKYLLQDAINPYTGQKLHGMAVRKFRYSKNI